MYVGYHSLYKTYCYFLILYWKKRAKTVDKYEGSTKHQKRGVGNKLKGNVGPYYNTFINLVKEMVDIALSNTGTT